MSREYRTLGRECTETLEQAHRHRQLSSHFDACSFENFFENKLKIPDSKLQDLQLRSDNFQLEYRRKQENEHFRAISLAFGYLELANKNVCDEGGSEERRKFMNMQKKRSEGENGFKDECMNDWKNEIKRPSSDSQSSNSSNKTSYDKQKNKKQNHNNYINKSNKKHNNNNEGNDIHNGVYSLEKWKRRIGKKREDLNTFQMNHFHSPHNHSPHDIFSRIDMFQVIIIFVILIIFIITL